LILVTFYQIHADGSCIAIALGHVLGSQTVSISTAEEWQKEIMADPKVTYPLHLFVDHIF
jgi:hypothetical protein